MLNKIIARNPWSKNEENFYFSIMIFHAFSDQVSRLLICLIKSCYFCRLSNQVPSTLNLIKLNWCSPLMRIKIFHYGCPNGRPHWLNFIHTILWGCLHWLNFSTRVLLSIPMFYAYHTLASFQSHVNWIGSDFSVRWTWLEKSWN